jgi:hypothetical protein
MVFEYKSQRLTPRPVEHLLFYFDAIYIYQTLLLFIDNKVIIYIK